MNILFLDCDLYSNMEKNGIHLQTKKFLQQILQRNKMRKEKQYYHKRLWDRKERNLQRQKSKN